MESTDVTRVTTVLVDVTRITTVLVHRPDSGSEQDGCLSDLGACGPEDGVAGEILLI